MGRFSGKKCRLLSMLWLTGSFFFVELIVGYITNSMALVADSFHMLSDVAALVIAFLSVKMSPKKWSKNTFGWARAEVLGALVNAVFLVALCFSITVEAVKRFIEIEMIHDAKLLVAVGTLGLILNIVGLFLFHDHGGGHGHSHGGVPPPANVRHLTEIVNSNADMALGHNATDTEETDEMVPPKPDKIPNNKKQTPCRAAHDPGHMNMKGVFLHILSDALGSLIVVGSALIVWLTDWEYKYYIDPALSIVLVILILASVWPLLRESSLILLQTVPTHIQVDAIQRRLLEKVDGVLAVHEFHVWQLAGDRIIASAHIRCRNLSEYMKIAEKVKEFFHNEGIHSTTIQPEFVELPIGGNEIISGASAEAPCALHCPPNDLCHNATCCGPNQQDFQEQSTPSPTVTPYLCRQRTMGSRTESMCSTNGAAATGRQATTWNLEALECGVLAQVSCEVVQPKQIRPNEGLLFINVEMNPMAAPHIEVNRQTDLAVHLNRMLEKAYKDSKCIDLESLCIVVEEKVWSLRVDIKILNHDGNLIECSSIATVTALAHFKRPDVTRSGDSVIIHNITEKDPIPTVLFHYPVCSTIAIFNTDILLADPNFLEESVCTSSIDDGSTPCGGLLIVGFNQYKEICVMNLCGAALSSAGLVRKALQGASDKCKEVVELVKKAIISDDTLRQKRVKINFSDVITQDHLQCLSKKDLKIKLKHYNIDDEVDEDIMDADSDPEPSKYDVVASKPQTAEIQTKQGASQWIEISSDSEED